jgi:sugar transferase (PEP-CTERM/EpsH1 system associated)
MDRLRILFLTSRFPLPPLRGDQLRAYHQIRVLSRRHDVTLLAVSAREPSREARERMASLCRAVIIEPFTAARALRGLARVILGDPRPLQTLLYAAAGRRARALLAGGGFDLVHAQLVRAAAWVPRPYAVPVVVDLVDTLSASYRRRAALEARWRRWPFAVEAARLAQYERTLLRTAGRCVVVSDTEREALGADGHRAVVNPNGIDLEAFPFVPGRRECGRVVFVGNLGYAPNADGIAWFARAVLPRLRRRSPGVELLIVGPRATRAVRRLARLPGVRVVGVVPDVHAVLAGARMAVAPLRAGGGIQNKVLEAMAAGTPVVATSRAIAGIAARAGEHCLVADDAAAFAAAAEALLGDETLGARIAAAGRALVADHYSWERSARGLEEVYRLVLEEAKGTGLGRTAAAGRERWEGRPARAGAGGCPSAPRP